MKVTIIIPVFNAEKHLEKCVNSILTQNVNDFEILLINDGSRDSSGNICDAFAKQDARIKVFHQNNSGVSAARNIGIDNAIGEWLTFIDSDDYILPGYFKVLESESTAELMIQGLRYECEGKVIKKTLYDSEELDFDKFLTKYDVYPYYSSSWSKFFKTAILKINKINFDVQLSFGEDTLFNLKYLLFCKRILTTHTLGYCYKVTETGLSSSVFKYRHDLHFYQKIKEQLEMYHNKDFYNKSIEVALTRLCKSFYSDNALKPVERQRILKEIVEVNYDVIVKIYADPKINFFFIIARITGVYCILDYALLNLDKKRR